MAGSLQNRGERLVTGHLQTAGDSGTHSRDQFHILTHEYHPTPLGDQTPTSQDQESLCSGPSWLPCCPSVTPQLVGKYPLLFLPPQGLHVLALCVRGQCWAVAVVSLRFRFMFFLETIA